MKIREKEKIEYLRACIQIKRWHIEGIEGEIKKLEEKIEKLSRYQPHKHGKEKRP